MAENGGEVAENGVEDGGKWRGVAASEFVNAERESTMNMMMVGAASVHALFPGKSGAESKEDCAESKEDCAESKEDGVESQSRNRGRKKGAPTRRLSVSSS